MNFRKAGEGIHCIYFCIECDEIITVTVQLTMGQLLLLFEAIKHGHDRNRFISVNFLNIVNREH